MNKNEKQEAYLAFLREKIKLAAFDGFDVAAEEINPALKPHTRDIVRWAVKGGNRAVFASFGLHKTVTALEWFRLIGIHRPGLRLNVCPLGIRHEFILQAAQHFLGEYAIDVRFIRQDSEIGDERTIYLTNYESVREGKINPGQFRAANLDEASVLRSYGSKTYQEFLPAFRPVEFKLVNTATPSPNRFKELIHYAGYLGIMDTGQALTRFFQRDSEKAGNLTLYPHKEKEFWLWVASWAVFIQRPSDLGHSDEGYDLPALDVRWHEVESDYSAAGEEKNGQGLLVPDLAMGLSAAAAEKRRSMPVRIARLMEVVNGYVASENEASAVLRGEQGQREGPQAGALSRDKASDRQGQEEGVHGCVSPDVRAQAEDAGAVGIEEQQAAGAVRDGSCSAGQAEGGSQGLADGKSAQAEGAATASIRSDAGAVQRNAGEPKRRLRNLRVRGPVGPEDISGSRSLPCDGDGARPAVHELQSRAGQVQGHADPTGIGGELSDQIIIWCDLNDEQDAIEAALTERGLSFSSIYGSLNVDEAERRLFEWLDRKTYALIGKPVMLGQGLNLQQCNKCVFIGCTYKFNDLIQAVHRVQRFGQRRQCIANIVHTESEREVVQALREKWAQHDAMQATMTEIIRTYGLNDLAMQDTLARTIGIERHEVKGECFTVANNDCVAEAWEQADNSVDLIVTSIPFANHYEYTPSYNDFGHTENNDHFWRQMDFLTPELLRILRPGRVYACHVKDRINFGNVTGAGIPTVSPFHAEALFHGIKHGFDYMGMITIVTDVVRENNQTYRLGYTEMCKDGTKMGVGSPEYVLLFHKPQSDRGRGYADAPVQKSKADYSLGRWQVDAHAFWRSSGNRLLTVEEMAAMGPAKLAKYFTDESLRQIYDYERHVEIGEGLAARNALPSTFMSLAPGSHHPDVWTDINRMRTLNGDQSNRAVEKHVCPLQFDIVDRLIERYSMKGEVVYDPFHGLGTVGVRAIKKGRKARGSELSAAYFADQLHYLRAAEREASMPTLFDMDEPQLEAA